jgi:hypothetical protein
MQAAIYHGRHRPARENVETHSEHRTAPTLGAFAREARAAHAVGVVGLPTAVEDAKRPLIRNWSRFKRQCRLSTVDRWAERFATANFAYLPGPSDLVVVDVDDRTALERAIEIFGPTPVVIETGKRGFHLEYRRPAGCRVPSMDLRRFGFPGEIKGERSLVVGPGSIHPETGRMYKFASGSWADLGAVPTFNMAALEQLVGKPIAAIPEPRSPVTERNPIGTRNPSLFHHLRALGGNGLFSSREDVRSEALHYNRTQQEVPEPDSKVIATADSVWKYITKGTCRAPKRGALHLTEAELAKLRKLGDGYEPALALFFELKRAHSVRVLRGETFNIVCERMAEEGIVPGWRDKKRYAKARDLLLRCKLIKLVSAAQPLKHRKANGKGGYAFKRAAEYTFGGHTNVSH